MTVAKSNYDISKYQKKLGKDSVLIRNGNQLDVFYGNSGWGYFARFVLKRTDRGMYLNQVLGDKLPNAVFKYVVVEVHK